MPLVANEQVGLSESGSTPLRKWMNGGLGR